MEAIKKPSYEDYKRRRVTIPQKLFVEVEKLAKDSYMSPGEFVLNLIRKVLYEKSKA